MSESDFPILPDDAELLMMINEIIDPADADRQVPALVRLLLAVANPDNNEQYRAAKVAAQYAWQLTSNYQICFEDFAGLNSSPSSSTESDERDEQETFVN